MPARVSNQDILLLSRSLVQEAADQTLRDVLSFPPTLICEVNSHLIETITTSFNFEPFPS